MVVVAEEDDDTLRGGGGMPEEALDEPFVSELRDESPVLVLDRFILLERDDPEEPSLDEP